MSPRSDYSCSRIVSSENGIQLTPYSPESGAVLFWFLARLFIQPKSKENPKKKTVKTSRAQGRQLSPRDDFVEPHANPTTPVRGNHRVYKLANDCRCKGLRRYRAIQVGKAGIKVRKASIMRLLTERLVVFCIQ